MVNSQLYTYVHTHNLILYNNTPKVHGGHAICGTFSVRKLRARPLFPVQTLVVFAQALKIAQYSQVQIGRLISSMWRRLLSEIRANGAYTKY